MTRSKRRLLLAVAAMVVVGSMPMRATKLDVSGAGWVRDRDLRLSLNRLLGASAKASLDANAIEDAAVIIMSALGDEGFQQPKIVIATTLADGTVTRFDFDPTFASPLPRTIDARAVAFRLTPGIRSHVDRVEFTGLGAMSVKDAAAFFRSSSTLIATGKINAYSPSRVNRAAGALLDELRQRGYAGAEVHAEKTNEIKGAVTIGVTVHEGPRWGVQEVRFQGGESSGVKLPATAAWVGRPWSPTLQEEVRKAVQHAYYGEGFPDVGVRVAAEAAAGESPPGQTLARVVVTIVPGTHVAVGQVRFQGNEITREPVLRRRVELGPGDPLNPLLLEKARARISRLGVFESVDLGYDPADGTVRDPVFTLKESPHYETNLLFGYGSYEQFRGGFEYRQMNLFGLAHQSVLEVVQSVKSTSADYTYTVPELFGESLDGTAKLFALQRQEIAFLRQEFGATVTLRRAVPQIGGEATLGYTFQALRNKDNDLATQATDESQVNVASVTAGLSGDRRDNRLRPRRGYHWAVQLEVADAALAGVATYQRLEVTGAYHTEWGSGRWIHIGMAHGAIATFGADDKNLPVNKRFYPGGDNSIRGYQLGGAAPRGPDGLFIGAKSYMLLNLELEQALTPNWSAVAFGDALGTAVELRNYPFNQRLYSVGLGVRYQTLIGPVRLEYGRNVHPRPQDPSGTLQFSVGYPF